MRITISFLLTHFIVTMYCVICDFEYIITLVTLIWKLEFGTII